MSKLTKEELDQYNSARQSYASATANLGHVSAHEKRIENEKRTALINYESARSSMESVVAGLEDKYGAGIRIDVSSGDIIKDDEPNN